MSEQKYLHQNSLNAHLKRNFQKQKRRMAMLENESNQIDSKKPKQDLEDDSDISSDSDIEKELTNIPLFYNSIDLEHDLDLLDPRDPLDQQMLSFIAKNNKYLATVRRLESGETVTGDEDSLDSTETGEKEKQFEIEDDFDMILR